MSVEASIIAAIVEGGSQALRTVYREGVSIEDFIEYEEEMQWIEDQAAGRQSLSVRDFRRKFPDFEWLPPTENLKELLPLLKRERIYTELNSLLHTVSGELDFDNAVEQSELIHEAVSQIRRLHAPRSVDLLSAGWREHLHASKLLRKLRDQGQAPGIPTGLDWIDFHWDGLVPGRLIVVLGRPGEGKSYLTLKFCWSAIKNDSKVLLFCPEHNAFENRCRLHTIASADKDVQKALGLNHSFRNRALMTGYGYNIKSYQRFLQFLEEEYGEIVMLSNRNRRQPMTVSYIESRIEDVQPDLVVIDPIYKVHSARAWDSKWSEIADVSDRIEELSSSYHIPIVITNQAHRQNTGAAERMDAPGKDKSHGSDVPIQEGDHVIGVKHISEERRMILRCTKSRWGEDFRFEVKFHPNTGVMRELTKPAGSYYNGSDDPDDDEVDQMVKNATRSE
jgi:archaellum biogenesis ATPase FlaH